MVAFICRVTTTTSVLLMILFVARCTCAFQISSHYGSKQNRVSQRQMVMDNDNNNNLGNQDLTSALARLDNQWQMEQQQKRGGSRWTLVELENQDDAYLLEPESGGIPSCIIFFVGGAGFGQFPQVAYSQFLERLSSRLNAAILTVPYEVGLDHFTLAKETGERLHQALDQVLNDSTKVFPEHPKVYCLAHSLGCKLATIHMAATSQDYDGVGLVSFNNFGFSQSIGMVRNFAETLRNNVEVDTSIMDDKVVMDTVFNLAENLIGTLGVEFSPSPADMDRIINLKYESPNTRLFTFTQDAMDNSREFCHEAPVVGTSVSELEGTHLTPVYFKFEFDNDEIMAATMESLSGFQKASFGDEEALERLLHEVSNWVLGKPPSREPEWREVWQGQRRISDGFSTNDS